MAQTATTAMRSYYRNQRRSEVSARALCTQELWCKTMEQLTGKKHLGLAWPLEQQRSGWRIRNSQGPSTDQERKIWEAVKCHSVSKDHVLLGCQSWPTSDFQETRLISKNNTKLRPSNGSSNRNRDQICKTEHEQKNNALWIALCFILTNSLSCD